ncbi:MAG: nucleotidyltransferase family protein [Candidatus Bathyarchaeota archaeon]|nr:nucleotidyltransferase family protein [Candidatus Bathyarchaeota archaeon]
MADRTARFSGAYDQLKLYLKSEKILMFDDKDYFTFAAHLSNPYLELPPQIREKLLSGLEYSRLYSVMLKNKILYRTLNRIDDEAFPQEKRQILKKIVNEQPFFSEAYEEVQFLRRGLLEINAALKVQGIELIFLKSRNHFPLDSDNFDVLVKDSDLSNTVKILESLGYVELTWVKEGYKRLFRKAKNAEDKMAIHLHSRMAWDGIEFLKCEDIWREKQDLKVMGETFSFPSSEHHLLITAAHAFFENHEFRLGDLLYTIDALNAQPKIDWAYIDNWVTEDNWVAPFYAMLQSQNYLTSQIYSLPLLPDAESIRPKKEQVNSKAKEITNSLNDAFAKKQRLPIPISVPTIARNYVSKIRKDPKITFAYKTRSVYAIAGDYVKRRLVGEKIAPSFVICFSGDDGTGKTTHALRLYEQLKSRGIDVTYMWSRGTGMILEPVLRIARKFLFGQSEATENEYYAEKRVTALGMKPLGLMWGYLAIFDHALKLNLRVRLLLARGKVVICDRYIQDTFFDAQKDAQTEIAPTIQKTFELLTPVPLIRFYMQNKGQSVNDAFGKDRRLCSAQLFVVDSNGSLEGNAKQILSHALFEYYSPHLQ